MHHAVPVAYCNACRISFPFPKTLMLYIHPKRQGEQHDVLAAHRKCGPLQTDRTHSNREHRMLVGSITHSGSGYALQ